MPIKSADKKIPAKENGKKLQRKTEEQFDQILHYMVIDCEYKLKELAEVLDVKERRVRTILKALEEMKKIEAIGSNKDRKYRRI